MWHACLGETRMAVFSTLEAAEKWADQFANRFTFIEEADDEKQ